MGFITSRDRGWIIKLVIIPEELFLGICACSPNAMPVHVVWHPNLIYPRVHFLIEARIRIFS